MENQDFEILKYEDEHREQLLDVWEKSVLASHHFLKQEDFLSIKELVKNIDFHALEVYCLVQKDTVYGFLGVVEQKLEMLFLSPALFGKGFGKKLMEFAIQKLKIDKVDVNEQNGNAVDFYKKFGFKTYQRTEKDDQGNDYPLLRMNLERRE